MKKQEYLVVMKLDTTNIITLYSQNHIYLKNKFIFSSIPRILRRTLLRQEKACGTGLLHTHHLSYLNEVITRGGGIGETVAYMI